jgi:hypothetical protein
VATKAVEDIAGLPSFQREIQPNVLYNIAAMCSGAFIAGCAIRSGKAAKRSDA